MKAGESWSGERSGRRLYLGGHFGDCPPSDDWNIISFVFKVIDWFSLLNLCLRHYHRQVWWDPSTPLRAVQHWSPSSDRIFFRSFCFCCRSVSLLLFVKSLPPLSPRTRLTGCEDSSESPPASILPTVTGIQVVSSLFGSFVQISIRSTQIYFQQWEKGLLGSFKFVPFICTRWRREIDLEKWSKIRNWIKWRVKGG